MYEDYKIYGPYTRKDGRKHVILINGDLRKTVSYPKYLIEQHLGRYLSDDETVDHIDEDFTNDNIDNLRILSRVCNIKRSSIRLTNVVGVCPICNVEFEYSKTQIKMQRYENTCNRAGPFCSKRCSGIYGSSLQNNRTEKLDRRQVEISYYKESKKRIKRWWRSWLKRI